MKKFFYWFLLLFSLIVNGVFLYSIHQLQEGIHIQNKKILLLEQSYPQIYDYLPSTLYFRFQEEVKKESDITFYVGRPSCSDCRLFEPQFIEIIKREHLENRIYYLNVTKIKENKKAWKTFKEIFEIQYTPALVKFKNGKLHSKIEWTPEKGANLNEFESWLKHELFE